MKRGAVLGVGIGGEEGGGARRENIDNGYEYEYGRWMNEVDSACGM